jgi:hypothetical protein
MLCPPPHTPHPPVPHPPMPPNLQVSSVRCTDGKCVGASLSKQGVTLSCVDLTGMRPFARTHAVVPSQGTASPGAEIFSTTAGVDVKPGVPRVNPVSQATML